MRYQHQPSAFLKTAITWWNLSNGDVITLTIHTINGRWTVGMLSTLHTILRLLSGGRANRTLVRPAGVLSPHVGHAPGYFKDNLTLRVKLNVLCVISSGHRAATVKLTRTPAWRHLAPSHRCRLSSVRLITSQENRSFRVLCVADC